MFKRLLGLVAKTLAVLIALGAVLKVVAVSLAPQPPAAASTQTGMSLILALVTALSVALAIAFWRLGSWLAPSAAASKPPAERQQVYQANMKQAAVWCAWLLFAVMGGFLLLYVVPSGGESIAQILPLLLMAAAIAFVRFCWFFIKARGRRRSKSPVRAVTDA